MHDHAQARPEQSAPAHALAGSDHADEYAFVPKPCCHTELPCQRGDVQEVSMSPFAIHWLMPANLREV
jgi:hypothetical protein